MIDLDRHAMRQRLLTAVRSGKAGALFPPVATDGPGGTLRRTRFLHGAADAAALSHLLDEPLIEVLIELDLWCRQNRARHCAVVADNVLDPFNADLFGPLVTAAFLGRLPEPGTVRSDLAAIELMLRRLEHDARADWFGEPEFALPAVRLRAHDAETHNGRQRVVRLDLAGGGQLAYKPRPATGEELFLAGPASVFGLLNDLAPASGPIQLPTLRYRPGAGPYSWQEWIEPPAEQAVLRREHDHDLTGTQLRPGQAEPFWHRAGTLAAACFAFGITDLGEGNLVVGPGPAHYPVDLEVYFTAGRRLAATGLITEPGDVHHHCGFENEPRWCSVDGPDAWFAETPDGLELRRTDRAWTRAHTRTVVVDSEGRAGYGPHLAPFLRGMFDCWTAICRHRDRLRPLLESPGHTRVLLRPTAEYAAERDDFRPTELLQLHRSDVPYFYRSTTGGPLLYWDPATQQAVDSGIDPTELPPADPVRRCERRTLTELGPALRDAIEFVAGELTERHLADDTLGVRISVGDADTGQVSFDWAGRRITYSWDGSAIRLRLRSLDELAAVRKRLLKLDHVDGHVRERWTDSDFTSSEDEQQLRELTDLGAAWLKQVIAKHGWPGTTLVGPEAAAAASRLVQHLHDQVAFQRDCLDRIRAAARAGDLPWRDVAYLTDTIRLNEGRPQVYGTKFRKEDGRLVPEPIEDAAQVDDRRAAMGLQPLAQYARRLHEVFG